MRGDDGAVEPADGGFYLFGCAAVGRRKAVVQPRVEQGHQPQRGDLAVDGLHLRVVDRKALIVGVQLFGQLVDGKVAELEELKNRKDKEVMKKVTEDIMKEVFELAK